MELESRRIIPEEVFANERITPLATVFPYAISRPVSLYNRIQKLGRTEELDVLDIFMARKVKADRENGELPGASDGMLSYSGGKFDTRNFFRGAANALQRDSSIAIVPFSEDDLPDYLQDVDPFRSFRYRVIYPNGNPKAGVYTIEVDGEDAIEVEAFPLGLYAIHPETITVIYPRRKERKVEELVGMSYSEFANAIDDGTYGDDRVVGAFTLGGDQRDCNFEIEPDQDEHRKSAIESLLDQIKNHQLQLKDKLKWKFISVLHQMDSEYAKSIPAEGSLEEVVLHIKGGKFSPYFRAVIDAVYARFTLEEYLKFYRKRESKMRRERAEPVLVEQQQFLRLEHADGEVSPLLELEDLGAVEAPEENPKYQQLEFPQWGKRGNLKKKLMARLRRNMEVLRESDLRINLGVDVKMMLPFIAQSMDYAAAKTTKACAAAISSFRDMLNLALIESDIGTYDQSFEDRLAMIQEFFRDESVPGSRKIEFLRRLDSSLITILKQLTDMQEGDLRRIWHIALQAPFNTLDEMGPAQFDLRQMHQIRNEMRKAGIGRAFLMAFRIDTKDNEGGWPKLTFESLSQLFSALSSTWEYPIYEGKAYVTNHPVVEELSSYFGAAIEREALYEDLTTGETYPQQVMYRTDPASGIAVIVDEKFGKKFHSARRKGRKDPFEEISDYDSASVVIPDYVPEGLEGSRAQSLTPEKRIEMAHRIVDGFETHLGKQFRLNGWSVQRDETKKTKDTLDNYFKFKAGESLGYQYELGEGSIAHRIIRLKVYFKVIDPNGREFPFEFSVYPFENLATTASEDDPIGLLGFRQKRVDDPRYRRDRSMARPDEPIGQPSIHELAFPPELYGWQIEEMLEAAA